MLNTDFSPWPSYSQEEADAVSAVLLSNRVNYWTGEQGRAFEREFADWTGSAYAVALNNGTVALDLALRALGIGPGDEVIVTPRSFVASASCVVNAGATPVFADVGRDSQNLSAATIAAVLSPRSRAVICVHLAGLPCEMDPIMALAARHGLAVIEDCAQAHGARYRGRMVGSIGDIGAWSFCQDKIISTGGEGGMVTTSRRDLWSALWSLKDHGKSWEAVHAPVQEPGFRWLHDSFGGNGRMLEMQAAIGRIQLRRMPEWSARRQANAARIAAACRPFAALRLPLTPDDCVHACYRQYVFVEAERLAPGWSRDRIIAALAERGVPCLQGSCAEIYREQAFVRAGLAPPAPLPVARELGQTSLMFLVHPTLTAGQLDQTCLAIADVMAMASR